MKKCENHKNTLMVSNETLVEVLQVILTNPEVDVYKIEKCDIGGWHIYWRIT